MGVTAPDAIRPYGTVIRGPGQLPEGLSHALAVRVPNVVSAIAGEAGRGAGRIDGFFEKSNLQEEKHEWKKTV